MTATTGPTLADVLRLVESLDRYDRREIAQARVMLGGQEFDEALDIVVERLAIRLGVKP